MRLLLGAEPFRAVLATAKQRAFHLETRDDYLTENEEPSLAAFRDDETTDPGGEWFTGWQEQVTAAVARGVVMQRARIVSEPVSDYIRYEHASTRVNVYAGEQVRWLPRRHASDIALPGNDFWLFDDHVIRWGHFSGDGAMIGHEISEDPAAAKLCAESFEAVWARAIPHDDYQIH